MKRAIPIFFSIVLALGSMDVAMAAPALKKARHLVPVPAIGLSRQGGAPIQTVSRGLRPDDRSALPLPNLATTVAADRLAPQRAQVLALRHRVALRYRGRGRGARLATELP
jgi:hypothetical protein